MIIHLVTFRLQTGTPCAQLLLACAGHTAASPPSSLFIMLCQQITLLAGCFNGAGTGRAEQDAVAVVGYPIGGDTISVTSGVVSRIEVTSYVHGSTELLGVQIDAAINSGNSGARGRGVSPCWQPRCGCMHAPSAGLIYPCMP